MTYCPWCHKDLGDRGSLPRHRRSCDFLPGHPWGAWQTKYLFWIERHKRTQGEAYANLARIFFNALSPDLERAGYVADQQRQLRLNLNEATEAEAEIRKLLTAAEMPKSSLGPDGSEHLRLLRAQAAILEARLHEIGSMRRFMVER